MNEKQQAGWVATCHIVNDETGQTWEAGDAIRPEDHEPEGWAGLIAAGAVEVKAEDSEVSDGG